MTLDEAIEEEKTLAVVNCDTATAYHTFGDAYSWEEEIHRQKAEYHGQIAEWLKDYKRLLEHESVLDKIRAEIMDWQTDIHDNEYDAETHDFVFERIYEIIDKYKAESEVEE